MYHFKTMGAGDIFLRIQNLFFTIQKKMIYTTPGPDWSTRKTQRFLIFYFNTFFGRGLIMWGETFNHCVADSHFITRPHNFELAWFCPQITSWWKYSTRFGIDKSIKLVSGKRLYTLLGGIINFNCIGTLPIKWAGPICELPGIGDQHHIAARPCTHLKGLRTSRPKNDFWCTLTSLSVNDH